MMMWSSVEISSHIISNNSITKGKKRAVLLAFLRIMKMAGEEV
jgi:hypothetical protein